MPTTHRTMCPMNCHPTLCGMQVTIEDGRLQTVAGDPENPDSEGFLCVRGKAARDIVHNAERLLTPMARKQRGSDDWQPIGWDEALERIVGAMQDAGRERVGMWLGHGTLANDYGTFANVQMPLRLGNMWGCQAWEGSMICWGLGGFGFGLTGTLEANTKEDMSANADLIIQWGSNLTSQPNTARHLAIAKQRGAKVIAIDVRVSEACTAAHEYHLVKPGTDAALALAMMHVIVRDGLHDVAFIAEHTVGFEPLREYLAELTPAWAAAITGIDADAIEQLAKTYAQAERAMLLVSGSSMYKDQHGWQASRAISCLPGLTGKIGKPGCGFGPRHAAGSHGLELGRIANVEARPPGNYIPAQMNAIVDAVEGDALNVMLLFGTNTLSSFADAGRMEAGFRRMDLVVSHDLFMNETARRCADIVLPSTSWLEDIGVKGTATHLYLMDKIMPAPGEARSLTDVCRALAERLGIEDYYPWHDDGGHVDAVIDTPSTGNATVASMRASGYTAELKISHVANPDHRYATPSGKLEFYSALAEQHGLPPLPTYLPRPAAPFPLELRPGRSMNQFHSFYDAGRVLPELDKRIKGPVLWISEQDARARGVDDGAAVKIFNQRGEFAASAKVTDRVPAGTVWMRDGWPGMNQLTDGGPSLPESTATLFPFTTGQAAYDAFVDVAPA
ncbi:MAG: molybdopterin-dependent oxidoreductase [Gammaproteobacteria bacterium]|nr:molybdopterin-dependent oxidoreductase [Gammaproteobacteria bacterium]